MMKPRVLAYVCCSVLLCVFFMLGFITSTPNAAPVTLNFEGTVTTIAPVLSGGPIALGDFLTGSVAYESSTPLFSSDPIVQTYHALTDLTFSVGAYSASRSGSPSRTINIFPPNTPGFSDVFNAITRNEDALVGAMINGLSLKRFGVALFDSSSTVFPPQQALPPITLPTSLSLSDFDSGQFGLVFSDVNNEFTIEGQFTAPVPTPSSFLLFATGLAGLVSWRRWSTKKVAA